MPVPRGPATASNEAFDASPTMPKPRSRGLLPLLTASAALTLCAAAQAESRSAADPTRADAPVPPLVYRSPLRSVPAAAPAGDAAWRDANDLTGRIGGWRSYLREAQQPPSTPGAAAPAPAAPAAPASAAPRATHVH